ncbi:TVP38/TMEM64 family protein [Lacticaseibacillus baoqingensis]|uniref:TVP38/TMEM64 family membrane protein n=1 Tax=Lacticaseibacillus baoqingensis TaxID=2486013 RepID=A0ABW4EAV0_9LACO|nr:VTT domain-containing protein [Lacticaseibacillus baoqingensis]
MTKQTRLRTLLIGLALVALVILVVYYWPLLTQLQHWRFDRAGFIHAFRHRGWLAVGPLVLLLIGVSLIPGAPNSVIAILSGVCLGAPLGFVVNVIGLSVGNSIGALFVDRVEARRHRQQQPSRLLEALLKMRHPRLGVLIGYAVPFIPNTLVHVAAGELALSRRMLVSTVALGSIPTAFFYAFGGDAVLQVKPARLAVVAALLGASALAIGLIRHDQRQR